MEVRSKVIYKVFEQQEFGDEVEIYVKLNDSMITNELSFIDVFLLEKIQEKKKQKNLIHIIWINVTDFFGAHWRIFVKPIQHMNLIWQKN